MKIRCAVTHLMRCPARFFLTFMTGFATLPLWTMSVLSASDEVVQFNQDVRPILANHCYHCHGPDSQARKGGLRLDVREHAIAASDSGNFAIVPGDVQSSHLIERILSEDLSVTMPPSEIQKPLSLQQKEILKRWIEQGAEYEPHWSFMTPQLPNLPEVKEESWPENEIDKFVLARLEQEGLQPSKAAESATLIRRLSFDLTGLPPSTSDVETFEKEMNDARTHATQESAESRQEAVYLKWVNRFLDSPHYGERMAVDWLDAARYADTNGYQVDRDRQMYLWRDWVINAFNSNMPFDQMTVEQIAGDLLPNATQDQKIATGFHRNHMLNEEGGVIPEEFLAEYCADRVETTAAVWLGQTFNCTRCHDHKFDPFTQKDFYGLYAFFHNVTEKGIGNYGADIRINAPPFLKVISSEQDADLARLRREHDDAKKSLADLDAKLVAEQAAWVASLLSSELSPSEQDSNDTAKSTTLPNEIRAILNKQQPDRSEAENKKVTEFQQSVHPDHKLLSEGVAALSKQIEEADKKVPTALVMEELPTPRETRVLIRGAYDKPGDVVTAATPASLPAMSPEQPRNRLGLARWLVAPENPLTARVIVNRLWQSLFGVGLVRTAEDFGTQGEVASHPELLDWLAVEFVRSGWDIKHMLRLMTSSATYRQSSRTSAELRERDPENRLLARGPRFRLQAEFLRDQALSASGLLVPTIGGPSVKSYHPAGLYEQVTAGSGTNVYVEGTGDDLHRRSMYSYWKRSVPNPAMLVFDAPFREACTLRRPRTNTPLQALNLMNDPTYVEAARFLAERMLSEADEDLASQLSYGFRLVLSRRPTSAEQEVLTNAFHRAANDYQVDVVAAQELLAVGAKRSADNHTAVQLAAMTIVASTILNLDEAIVKE